MPVFFLIQDTAMYTCVSARTILRGTVSSVSSESDPSHKAENLLAQQSGQLARLVGRHPASHPEDNALVPQTIIDILHDR